jgi:pilus assembly protein CpaB
MNAKTWIPLSLAVLCAIGAALVARQMMMNRPADDTAGKGMLRTIVFANDNMLAGTEITPTMITTGQVSAEMVNEDTFEKPDDLVGRVTQAPVYKGQPILATLLAAKGSPSGIGVLIPQGMRAITIEVNEFSGVGGFLTPGCRVDVLATVQGEKNGEMLTQTVVQNVMVVAIGQRMSVQREKDEGAFRSATIIASAEEAQAIELAAATSRPRLVLRNSRDDAKESGPGVTLSDIRGTPRSKMGDDPFAAVHTNDAPLGNPTTQPTLGSTDTQPTEPKEPETWSIKVIRAGATSEVSVPLSPKDSKTNTRPNRTRVQNTSPTVQPTRPSTPVQRSTLGEPITGVESMLKGN